MPWGSGVVYASVCRACGDCASATHNGVPTGEGAWRGRQPDHKVGEHFAPGSTMLGSSIGSSHKRLLSALGHSSMRGSDSPTSGHSPRPKLRGYAPTGSPGIARGSDSSLP